MVRTGQELALFAGLSEPNQCSPVADVPKKTKLTFCSENGRYAGDLPLCKRCNFYHNGPCTGKCNICNKVGHLSKNCRNKKPTNGSNQLPVTVEDASKQGRKIHDIDADEDITLENVYDAEMVDTGVLDDEEVFAEKDVAEKEVSTADLVTTDGEVVTTASVEVSTSSPTELTLAQTLIEIKSAKPKVKGVVIEEKSESTTRTRPQQLPSKDKGKGKMVEPEEPIKKKDQIRLDEELAFRLQAEEEEAKIGKIQEKKKREKRNKPLTKAQQRSIMTTYLKNMAGWKPKDLKNKSFANVQELFEKAMKRVNIFVEMDTKLVEGNDDQETTELQSMMEIKPDEEEVVVDVIPLATKPPSIVD
ncbi:putative ribonuclease H-like domain-containing protein [Tanacetum coccineum]